jgi:hypothetical protein
MMSLTILGAKLKEQRTAGLQCLTCAMEEEGTLSRTPLVVQLNATEDAIEIFGEQPEESNENKGHNYI